MVMAGELLSMRNKDWSLISNVTQLLRSTPSPELPIWELSPTRGNVVAYWTLILFTSHRSSFLLVLIILRSSLHPPTL